MKRIGLSDESIRRLAEKVTSDYMDSTPFSDESYNKLREFFNIQWPGEWVDKLREDEKIQQLCSELLQEIYSVSEKAFGKDMFTLW